LTEINLAFQAPDDFRPGLFIFICANRASQFPALAQIVVPKKSSSAHHSVLPDSFPLCFQWFLDYQQHWHRQS